MARYNIRLLSFSHRVLYILSSNTNIPLDFIKYLNTTRVNYTSHVLTTVKERIINILYQLNFSKNCKK